MMAYPFGGLGRMSVPRQGQTHAQKTDNSEQQHEKDIREGARSLTVPGTALLYELLVPTSRALKSRERDSLEKLAQIDRMVEIQTETVRAEQTRQQGYPHVVGTGLNGSSANGTDGHLPARTIPAKILAIRKEAEPIGANAVKLVVHIGAAGAVIMIEITLFHGALDVAFEPILGAPTQAMSNGLLAMVCLTAVLAGLWSFGEAGERTKRWMKKLSMVAVATFLAGSALFVGHAIHDALNGGLAASEFDLEATGAMGPFGSLGLAVTFASAGALAWVASHHSLGRVRALATDIMRSLRLRKSAADMQRDYIVIGSEGAGQRHALEEVQEEYSRIEMATACRASALCAPYLSAGKRLITQLELNNGSLANFVPDPLIEEAMAYDLDLLRQKVAEFEAGTQPAALLKKLRGITTPKKKGKPS